MKKAVVIYGPPGSGKGTQANLLSWAKNFIHFDTGRYLEELLHNPTNQKDSIIQRERIIFDRGELNTPNFVLKIVREKTQEIACAGLSIIFSGSPRTIFEAFGDEKNQGLVKTLEETYGRENIYFILLKVKPDSSINRNAIRKICSSCKLSVLANHKGNECPICGGKLEKRKGGLDDPEKYKVRLKEYQERTEPIFRELKECDYEISRINGEPAPYKIHQDILKVINNK